MAQIWALRAAPLPGPPGPRLDTETAGCHGCAVGCPGNKSVALSVNKQFIYLRKRKCLLCRPKAPREEWRRGTEQAMPVGGESGFPLSLSSEHMCPLANIYPRGVSPVTGLAQHCAPAEAPDPAWLLTVQLSAPGVKEPLRVHVCPGS